MGQTLTDERVPSSWTQRENGSWDTDIYGTWTDEEEAWLYVCAGVVDHGLGGHDPVECQRHVVPSVLAKNGRREWRTIREAEGLTMNQLAELLDVSPATVSRWEAGKRWPDDFGYIDWLQETDQTQVRRDVWGFVVAILKRDGWFQTDKAQTGPGVAELIDDMWPVVYKEGGLLDKWRETGSLPHWTPAAAGAED